MLDIQFQQAVSEGGYWEYFLGAFRSEKVQTLRALMVQFELYLKGLGVPFPSSPPLLLPG